DIASAAKRILEENDANIGNLDVDMCDASHGSEHAANPLSGWRKRSRRTASWMSDAGLGRDGRAHGSHAAPHLPNDLVLRDVRNFNANTSLHNPSFQSWSRSTRSKRTSFKTRRGHYMGPMNRCRSEQTFLQCCTSPSPTAALSRTFTKEVTLALVVNVDRVFMEEPYIVSPSLRLMKDNIIPASRTLLDTRPAVMSRRCTSQDPVGAHSWSDGQHVARGRTYASRDGWRTHQSSSTSFMAPYYCASIATGAIDRMGQYVYLFRLHPSRVECSPEAKAPAWRHLCRSQRRPLFSTGTRVSNIDVPEKGMQRPLGDSALQTLQTSGVLPPALEDRPPGSDWTMSAWGGCPCSSKTAVQMMTKTRNKYTMRRVSRLDEDHGQIVATLHSVRTSPGGCIMDNLGLGSPSRHFGYCVTVKIVSRPPSRVPLIGVMRKWPPKRDSDELLADVHRSVHAHPEIANMHMHMVLEILNNVLEEWSRGSLFLGPGSPRRRRGCTMRVVQVDPVPSIRKYSHVFLSRRTNLRLRCACCSESANQRPKKSLGVLASHNERQHPSTRKFWEDVLKRTDELVDTESLTLCVSGSRVERFCCRNCRLRALAIVYIQNDSRDFINSHDQRITGDKQVDGHSQYISILEHIVLEIAC
ncbi:hypothetical protein L227DRAFT_568740, partial [Lentinus tigrinus ALCF2SS1-6]